MDEVEMMKKRQEFRKKRLQQLADIESGKEQFTTDKDEEFEPEPVEPVEPKPVPEDEFPTDISPEEKRVAVERLYNGSPENKAREAEQARKLAIYKLLGRK
jgi:hypothetical protein